MTISGPLAEWTLMDAQRYCMWYLGILDILRLLQLRCWSEDKDLSKENAFLCVISLRLIYFGIFIGQYLLFCNILDIKVL